MPNLKTATTEIRADLIKRLFAVAISVGFATSLAGMPWVRDGVFPKPEEWPQLAILATALIATVLSWDGYLLSIDGKPLGSFWRFTIDVVLVFIYMFLLLTSKHDHIWLRTLALIFILYFLWDVFTVKEYPRNYDLRDNIADKDVKSAFGIYFGGVLNRAAVNRGPVITLVWAIYFVFLAIIFDGSNKVFAACSFALLGLFLYRKDKRFESRYGVRGFSMQVRVGAAVALLALAYVYSRYLDLTIVLRFIH